MAIKKMRTKAGEPAYRIVYYVLEKGVRRRKQETLAYVNRRTAEEILAARKTAALRGENLKPRPVKNPTVKTLLDKYLEATEEKRSHRRDLSSAPHLREHLGRVRVKDLIPDDIETYRRKRRKEKTPRGTPPTDATLNREVALLKAVMSWAHRNKHVDDLLLRGVSMLDGEVRRNRVLSYEEYHRLLDASPSHLRNIIICAWETGMRLGEILSLTWGQVDKKNQLFRLRAAQTKDNEDRLVPITDPLEQVLVSIPTGLPNINVFLYNGKPITHQVQRSFDRARQKAGLADVRFHDLRHCYVTRMRRGGLDKETIMKITGHATDAMFYHYRAIEKPDVLRAIEVSRKTDAEADAEVQEPDDKDQGEK